MLKNVDKFIKIEKLNLVKKHKNLCILRSQINPFRSFINDNNFNTNIFLNPIISDFF